MALWPLIVKMFLFRKRHAFTQSKISPSSSNPSDENPCLIWTNLVLAALLPLMIGIATVIITVQQRNSEIQRRDQDLQIARENREQDQRQADELYLQDVYKTYIREVSSTLLKGQQSANFSFVSEQAKMAYIRSQTLTALEELDPQRKTRLFLFLYENNLLPKIPPTNQLNENGIPFTLSRANLAGITLRDVRSSRLQFNRLSLTEVDLTNSSFIGCNFLDGVDFQNSDMNNIKFATSEFRCRKVYTNVNDPLSEASTFFHDATLINADFGATQLCDVSFNGANMTSSNFTHARFWGRIVINGADLSYADFTNSRILAPVLMIIKNTNMLSAHLENGAVTLAAFAGLLDMTNVILPNGTWLLSERNIVINGNAEVDCSADSISHWGRFSPTNTDYPILSLSNGTNGSCYFNFTIGIDGKDVAMYQDAAVSDFSLFIDSNQTEYHLSADAKCDGGLLIFDVLFFNEDLTRLYSERLVYKVDGTQVFNWHTMSKSGHIPVTTRTIEVQISVTDKASCCIDTVELRIRQLNARK